MLWEVVGLKEIFLIFLCVFCIFCSKYVLLLPVEGGQNMSSQTALACGLY